MTELTTSLKSLEAQFPEGRLPDTLCGGVPRLRLIDGVPGLIEDRPRGPLIEVAIPVYNEEHVLEASVRRLHSYLKRTFPYPFLITVADNASIDHTWDVARRLAREVPEVKAVHLDQKGRGRALRQVWTASEADVVAYMDVDLSTDLDAFLPLIA